MTQHLENLRILDEASTEVGAILPHDHQDRTFDQLTELLAHLTRLKANVESVLEAVSTEMAGRMQEDQVVSRHGLVSRRARFSSTWIDDTSRERLYEDAVRAIVRRVATDPDSGEIRQNVAQAVRETWQIVMDCFSLGADPKAPARKILGIQSDEYRAKRMTGHAVSLKTMEAPR